MMRGLMVKDYKLMMQKKKYFVIFAVMAVFLSFSMKGSFIISYLTMIGLIMAISTISSDEFDNGLPFLMTLPVSRKDYAVEKVLFSCLSVLVFWLLGGILQVIVSAVMGNGLDFAALAAESIVFLMVFLFILALMVPIELHFGMEKSRIAMVAIGGICFAIGVFGPKLMTRLGIDPRPLAAAIESIPPYVLMAGGIAVTIFALFLSMVVTTRVMERKEF
jgi:hypothetical protein